MVSDYQFLIYFTAWWVGRSWSSRFCWKTEEIVGNWRSLWMTSSFWFLNVWFLIPDYRFLISDYQFPISFIAWWVGWSWSYRLCWKIEEIVRNWRSLWTTSCFWFPSFNSWLLISGFWFSISNFFYSLMSWTKLII